MILIVLHHYTAHGGLANVQNISFNSFLREIINIGGELGAIIFIIIIGYFMIESKFKIKKLLKIIMEVFIYSFVITVILIICNKMKFSIKDVIKAILPISYMQYWFITYYIGVYIFSPFLNKFINSLDKKIKTFLIICGIAFVIIPIIVISTPFFYNGFCYMIYMYMIGVYIKNIILILNKGNA